MTLFSRWLLACVIVLTAVSAGQALLLWRILPRDTALWRGSIPPKLALSDIPLPADQGLPSSFAPMLAKVIPAVVTIRVIGETFTPQEIKPRRTELESTSADVAASDAEPERKEFRTGGSGVVLDAENGYILTNNHVIEKATKIDVGLSDGRRMLATLVGRDIGTDVAVIKVSAKELPSIRIADSDGVRVGDVVAAVGNPFGLEGSATLGIISAVMRAEIGYEEFEDFFQFDAMIHPGNSGGALVNGKGELIGINTVVAGPKGNPFGIGFAIPINMAKFVQNEIVAQGYVRRGSPGLVVGDLPPEMTTIEGGVIRRGALVKEVLPGSPAAAVGIKPGDVVFSIANKPVRGAAEYMTRIVSQPAGSSVPIGLWIDGKDARVIEVMLSSQAFKSTRTRLRRLMGTVAGLDVVDILPNSDLYDEYRGVEVKGVPPRSPAYAAGFEVGDIIVGIEGGKVRNTEDLITRIDAVGLQYRVDIVRNGRPFWIRASR